MASMPLVYASGMPTWIPAGIPSDGDIPRRCIVRAKDRSADRIAEMLSVYAALDPVTFCALEVPISGTDIV